MGWWECWVGKVTCCKFQWPELDTWAPPGRRRDWLLKAVFWDPYMHCCMQVPTYICTHTQKKWKLKKLYYKIMTFWWNPCTKQIYYDDYYHRNRGFPSVLKHLQCILFEWKFNRKRPCSPWNHLDFKQYFPTLKKLRLEEELREAEEPEHCTESSWYPRWLRHGRESIAQHWRCWDRISQELLGQSV